MPVLAIRKSLPLIMITILCPLGATWGQTPASNAPTRGRQLAQSLLDQLGSGSPNAASQAASDALQGAGGVNLSNVAGLDRAQSFLDKHAPGTIDLRRKDLGLGATQTDPAPASARNQLHRSAANEAARAFREGEYARSVRWLVAVTSDLPQDGELRQFESLAWLAVGHCDKSEAALVAALQHSQPWTQTRMNQFFEDSHTYGLLMQHLRTTAAERADVAQFWLLVAYHERIAGNQAECIAACKQARNLDVAREIPTEVYAQLGLVDVRQTSVLD